MESQELFLKDKRKLCILSEFQNLQKEFQNMQNADKNILFMSGESKLRYPATGASIGACRAYFKIGEDGAASNARIVSFNLNFGDGETTGIDHVQRSMFNPTFGTPPMVADSKASPHSAVCIYIKVRKSLSSNMRQAKSSTRTASLSRTPTAR